MDGLRAEAALCFGSPWRSVPHEVHIPYPQQVLMSPPLLCGFKYLRKLCIQKIQVRLLWLAMPGLLWQPVVTDSTRYGNFLHLCLPSIGEAITPAQPRFPANDRQGHRADHNWLIPVPGQFGWLHSTLECQSPTREVARAWTLPIAWEEELTGFMPVSQNWVKTMFQKSLQHPML